MNFSDTQGLPASIVTTRRLTTRVLFAGPAAGEPVLFLHGDLSTADWWVDTMTRLPGGFLGIAPDQRGYGDADPSALIDARRGVLDLAEDVVALLDELAIPAAHVIGNGLGGAVLWRLLMHHTDRLRSVTLVAPISPYGFGGTRGTAGEPCFPDFAGTGAGMVNPRIIAHIAEGDREAFDTFSPRRILRMVLFKPHTIHYHEDRLVNAMLKVHRGERSLPGDHRPSPHWPYVAPGDWGPANALSPQYAGDTALIASARQKPPILWVRGSEDSVIADDGGADAGALGRMGVITGWPGPDVYPPQPMVTQTRSVLAHYQAAGGSSSEEIIQGTGHLPFLERPDLFDAVFHRHLIRHRRSSTPGS